MGAGLIDDFIRDILCVPFCPYHFVHTILSHTILSVYHFVRTILSVPFCPVPFCPVTLAGGRYPEVETTLLYREARRVLRTECNSFDEVEVITRSRIFV